MIPLSDRRSNEEHSLLLLSGVTAFVVIDFVYETYRKRITGQYICSMCCRVFKQSKLPDLFNTIHIVDLIISFNTIAVHIVQLRDEAQMECDVGGQLQCCFLCTQEYKNMTCQFTYIIETVGTYKCNTLPISGIVCVNEGDVGSPWICGSGDTLPCWEVFGFFP